MQNQHDRTALLIGENGLKALAASRVAVFGLGGVGSFALEGLVRSGVGAIDAFDFDRIEATNINRQILATHETIGMQKAFAAASRAASINPDAEIRPYTVEIDSESIEHIDFSEYDYILDCIDSVSAKILIAQKASREGTRLISCMGVGRKLDPTKLQVADIYQTSVCPLAKVMRRELRRLGVPSLVAVFSSEAPSQSASSDIGSMAFVPAAAGMIMASVAVQGIVGGQS
ncbi:MAG: tRNA threonylcarbamoyladenosine dehydratase [Eubacteriaceae bacterium]|nr:tRNA threonylcarbamoyladenosine dehydratase [Eubacteriaceae bacterium]